MVRACPGTLLLGCKSKGKLTVTPAQGQLSAPFLARLSYVRGDESKCLRQCQQ